jgi:CheY-like chemotaxis protein
LARTGVLKVVHSPDRLADEATLFLHAPIETLAPTTRKLLEDLHRAESRLAGKKVLLVDDDIRNIFAMTSLLERHQVRVLSAETGNAALAQLEAEPDVDAVLMDIMMPAMDGYDTMRAIRQSPEFSALPIIALTAKAMVGDREKCLEAGASDYIAKPVIPEHLLATLGAWLPRRSS